MNAEAHVAILATRFIRERFENCVLDDPVVRIQAHFGLALVMQLSGPEVRMKTTQRIRELLEEGRVLSGGKMIVGGLENLPPEVAEEFLERVMEFERSHAQAKEANKPKRSEN